MWWVLIPILIVVIGALLLWRAIRNANHLARLSEIASELSLEEAALALNETLVGLASYDFHAAQGRRFSSSKYAFLETACTLYERVASLRNPTFTKWDKSGFRMKLAAATVNLTGASLTEQMAAIRSFRINDITEPKSREHMDDILTILLRLAR